MLHSSYANETIIQTTRCNERLEFLGDAVLELSCSEFIFPTPGMPEARLTKIAPVWYANLRLAFCARDIELGKSLRLGKGEEQPAEERENLSRQMRWRH